MNLSFPTTFRISLVFLLACGSMSSYGQANFQKFYGGSGDDLGQVVDTTFDKGYILSGITNSSGAGSYDFFLMKLDSSGTIEWQNTYGGNATEESINNMCVKQTIDSGYVFTGRTNSFGANGWDGYICKVDKNGNVLWSKIYGSGNSNESFHYIELASDSGLLITGSDNIGGFGGADGLIIKLDANGNEEWKKVYGGTAHDHHFCSIKSPGDGYYIVGQSQTFGPGVRSISIKHIDSVGNILWEQFYGGVDFDHGTDIKRTLDTGIIALGHTNSFGAGQEDFLLVKTDSIGNLEWSKTYGGANEERPASVRVMPDSSGYLLYGYTHSFGTGSRDLITIRTDIDGNVLWSKTFGKGSFDGNSFNSPQALELTPDGGFVQVGYSDSINIGSNDIFLVKSDNLGNGLCEDVVITVTSPSISVSGPASSVTSIGTIANVTTIANTSSFTDTLLCFCNVGGSAYPDTAICEGASVTLHATGGTSYDWSTGGTTSSINVIPVASTTYSVTIFDGTCDVVRNVTVTVDTIPVPYFAGEDTVCLGDSSLLAAFGGGDYLWSTSATSDSIYISPVNDSTYYLTITNGACSATDSFPVTVIPYPNLTLSNDTTLCENQATWLVASGGNDYLWSTGSNNDSINVAPLVDSTYYVTVSNFSCSVTDSVIISVDSLPLPQITGADSLCQGDSTTLTVGGAPGYSWSTGSTTNSITVSPNTSTTYYVTATNGVCEVVDSIAVVVTPSPTLNVSNDTSICAPATINLTANSSSAVAWSTGSNSSTISVSPTTSTTYYVTATEGKCSVTDSVVVLVDFTPSVNILGNPNICVGQSLILEAQGIGNFTWSTGSNDTTIVVSPNNGQTYYVTTSNSCGLDVDSITITVHPPASASAETDTTILAGESVQLSGTGGPSWLWSPPDWLSCTTCANPVATPPQTTTYYLTVIDENGCAAIDSVIIIVDERQLAACEDAVFVPNIFSPNSDGQNDVLYARGIDYDLEVFRIFDRWGNKVFETTDPTNGWDGKHNGTLANSGVFAFYVEAICHLTGETLYFQGNVTLIR